MITPLSRALDMKKGGSEEPPMVEPPNFFRSLPLLAMKSKKMVLCQLNIKYKQKNIKYKVLYALCTN